MNVESVDTSRYECLNGQLLERPLPTVDHAEVQLRVLDLVRHRGRDLGFAALQEVSIEESATSRNEWLTPDVLVASGARFEKKANGHAVPPALLAVEVLSPGQSFLTMRPKARTLLLWGVASVWLIDPASATAMIFSGDPDSARVVFEGALQAGDLTVTLNELFNSDPAE